MERQPASNGTRKHRMEPAMATILPFLQGRENVFDPKDVTAMSMALDDVCKALNLRDDSAAREVIAVRIIDLAKGGERSPTRLRDRVLHEAGMAERIGLDGAEHEKQADAEHEKRIREKAYQLWQADGAPEGKADHYWHLARELISRGE